MDAANTYIEAALVHADEEAALRLQVVEVVRKMVETELQVMVMDGRLNPLVGTIVRGMEFEIKKMALRAVKEHFQNPQQIY